MATVVVAFAVFFAGSICVDAAIDPTSVPTGIPTNLPSLAPSPPPTGPFDVAESSALELLYKFAGGTAWFTRTHWQDQSKPLSEWYGVEVTSGSVTELKLEGNKVAGTLPTELGLLSKVEVFYISSNDISSTLPSELGLLSKAMDLGLSNNAITSAIPTEFGQLKEMVNSLTLNSNKLNGTIPTQLGKLSTMITLDLATNAMTSSLPTELALLSKATGLGLSSNAMTSSLPTELARLSKMKALDVAANSITSSLPTQVGRLSNVEAFYVFSNALSSSLPSELGLLSKATDLRLENNALAFSVPTELARLSHAETFLVFSNALSSSLPSELGLLSKVTIFDLKNNDITSSVPTEVGRLSKMEFFALQANSLTSSLPTEVGRLSTAEVFYIFSNALSSSLPSELGLLSKVTTFGLSNNAMTSSLPTELGELNTDLSFELKINSFSSALPTELGRLGDMTLFYAYSNLISSSIPTQLCRLSNLVTLGLSNNHISSSLPSELFQLSSLRDFYLLSNELSSSLPSELGVMTAMTYFNPGNNRLTSSLPSELGLMSNLEYLDCGGNFISSSLPSEIALLSGLTHIQLQESSIASTVPTELGKLTGIERLFLNRNSLKGSLPSQLGSMSAMQLLRLDDNKFTAQIPSEIGRLENLKVWTNADNYLRGAVPTEFGSLTTLHTVALNNNYLRSTLPNSICNVTSLVIVALSANELMGRLPDCRETRGFPKLKVFDVAKNNFRGALPSVKQWPLIRYLLLHKNQFSGTLAALEYNITQHDTTSIRISGDGDSNLVALTLHDNSLTGRIPNDLSMPRSIETLTLANNDLSGRLPPELLNRRDPENRSMTLFATNNRLSCKLPSWNFTSNRQSLALIGNRFSWPPPKWVNPIETHSTFLSVIVRSSLEGFKIPLWLAILIQACAVGLIAVPLIIWYRRTLIATRRSLSLATPDGDEALFSPMSRSLFRCSKGIALLGCPGLAFLVLFGIGSNYYECGDAFIKFTTAAYLANSYTSEMILAFGSIGWTAALALVLLRMAPPPSPPAKRESARPFATDQSGIKSRPIHLIMTCLLFVGWFLSLVVFGGLPTVFYVATYSLPAKNELDLKASWVHVIASGLAFYLSLMSSLFIPAVTRVTVRVVFGNRMSARDSRSWESAMGITARTLVIVILPVVSVLLLDNSCFAMWFKLWRPCREKDYFEKEVSVSFLLYQGFDGNDHRYDIPYLGEINLNVLDTNAVCDSPHQQKRCARDVLEILCPLFIAKLIYSILIAAMQPLVAPLRATGKHRLHQIWRRWRNDEQRPSSMDIDVVMPEEPDPMDVLIWYETAFIFGCLSPLLILLLAVQLYFDTIAFEWRLRRAPSMTDGAEPLLMSWRFLKAHLVLILFLQATMVVFFFVETKLRGWQVVAACVPAVFIGEVLFTTRCWQRGQLKRSTRMLLRMPANSIEIEGSSGHASGTEMVDADNHQSVENGGEDNTGLEEGVDSRDIKGSTNTVEQVEMEVGSEAAEVDEKQQQQQQPEEEQGAASTSTSTLSPLHNSGEMR